MGPNWFHSVQLDQAWKFYLFQSLEILLSSDVEPSLAYISQIISSPSQARLGFQVVCRAEPSQPRSNFKVVSLAHSAVWYDICLLTLHCWSGLSKIFTQRPSNPSGLEYFLHPCVLCDDVCKLLWIWQFSRRLSSGRDPVSGVTTQWPADAYSQQNGRGQGFQGLLLWSFVFAHNLNRPSL